MIIKILLFFFSFALYYTINAIFYTEKTIGNILNDKGKYNFIYQLPKLIYSNLISAVINILMQFLSLSEKQIISIKNDINKQKKFRNIYQKLKKQLLIKFILFYILYFIFLLFFWFYITCFCIVYKNTQIYLIKDTIISFSFSFLYPLLYYLLPSILRIWALRDKKKNKEFAYKLSTFLQLV